VEQVLEPSNASRTWPAEWLERIRVVEEPPSGRRYGYVSSH